MYLVYCYSMFLLYCPMHTRAFTMIFFLYIFFFCLSSCMHSLPSKAGSVC